MALSKAITDEKGMRTEYHRIIATSQVFVAGSEAIHINLAGYASEAYRNVEKTTGDDKILSTQAVMLPLVDEDFSRAKLYQRIKEECELFKDAVDV